jgi:hypothetical protein
MNSFVNSDNYPCFWGTFLATATLLSQLLAGSQAAVRDVAEAYRIIPLHPSQWPGTVVRTSNNNAFCIDTFASFGGAANCEVFGKCADAACDILRAKGMGPILKWVDDHLFVRIPSSLLPAYNKRRKYWQVNIQRARGLHQSGGRLWFRGPSLVTGTYKEFAENIEFPLKNLTGDFYPYTLQDIDQVTSKLGIPWEKQKDRDFSAIFTFTGFLWDLSKFTVTLSNEKRDKYLLVLKVWAKQQTHTLEDTQKLYGKLLHTTALVPEGCAYLTSLECMIGLF